MNDSFINQQVNNLLNSVRELQKTRQQEKLEGVKQLLNDAQEPIEKINQKIKKEALKFNIFSALGVTRKEVIQSRFLAYLLDPNEQHCQGSLFLNAFLTKINLPKINDAQWKNVRVTAEQSADEGHGRMDIVLSFQSEWIVVIENKIDAGEGDKQLERYDKWLQLKKQRGSKEIRLVFLTPTGHESETGGDGNSLRFSYLDLADMFETCSTESMPESIRVILNQYIITCKTIGGMTMTVHKELLDILKKPENIKIALEIEQQTHFIRGEIIEIFGKNIKKILQDKLKSEKLVGIWMADIRFWNNDNTLNVEIRTSKRQPNYSMVSQLANLKSNDGRFGWLAPELSNLRLHDVKELSSKMDNDGCNPINGRWLCYKNLRETNTNNGILTTDIDDICACLEDNFNNDHPLAHSISDELWSMFIAYREDIEELESFKKSAYL